MKSIMKSACSLLLAGSMLCPALVGCNQSEDVTTTVPTTQKQEESVPHAELLAANTYAAAGETLMEETIDT